MDKIFKLVLILYTNLFFQYILDIYFIHDFKLGPVISQEKNKIAFHLLILAIFSAR